MTLTGLSAAAAAPVENPTLFGVVGPDFSISLKDSAGAAVTHIETGTYTVQVNDLGEVHNFHLSGPGVDEVTGVASTGEVRWTVTFQDGTYTFRCDPHNTIMRGTFTAGTVTPPPPPPAKLSGRIGPGAKIVFPAKASAGKATITIRDRSAVDNFHLRGPGVNRKTGVKFKGTVTWTVTLAAGVYTFRSDAHPRLRGKTTVT